MKLKLFLEKITTNEPISFEETIAIITEHYDYQPTEFANGLGDSQFINRAGTNEGSCKIFAFAKIHRLTQQQTLQLFGDFYRLDVLTDPSGTGHQNIRNFMRFGWDGLRFTDEPLSIKAK
jgi:HopJ type III effector protein